MVWRSMPIYGLGVIYRIEGHLNQQDYQQILEEHFYGTIHKFNLDALEDIFQ